VSAESLIKKRKRKKVPADSKEDFWIKRDNINFIPKAPPLLLRLGAHKFTEFPGKALKILQALKSFVKYPTKRILKQLKETRTRYNIIDKGYTLDERFIDCLEKKS
jgi:hypothetical protein